MRVEEIRLLPADPRDDRLLAYAEFTLVGPPLGRLVVRDVRLVTTAAARFVSMPTRKMNFACGSCGSKNVVAAQYCNWCGFRLKPPPPRFQRDGREALYADVIFPADAGTRETLTAALFAAYDLAAADTPPFQKGMNYARPDAGTRPECHGHGPGGDLPDLSQSCRAGDGPPVL